MQGLSVRVGLDVRVRLSVRVGFSVGARLNLDKMVSLVCVEYQNK